MTTPDVPAGRDELPSVNDLREWAGRWLDEHRAEAAQSRRFAALLRSPEAPDDPLGTAEESEADAESADAEAAMYAAILALLGPQEAPAEGISLSAQLSQAAAWMRVWDECQRLGMDTYGAPSTSTGLDIVLDFIRGRAAPQEAREPELLGYVVERQLTPGEWVRVWRGSTMWVDHDEAVLDRDAYALDGIPAHIRPVYLGAPAPTEPSAPEPKGLRVYGNILPPDAPEALHVTLAPASGEPSGADAVAREAWRSVIDSLPKPGADVIAGYRDTAGRWRSVRAVYAAARSVVCTCEFDGDCLCEMDDTGESWWPEGWYEIADNAYDVNTWRIRGTVTHWMPLPQAPTAPGAPEEGAGE